MFTSSSIILTFACAIYSIPGAMSLGRLLRVLFNTSDDDKGCIWTLFLSETQLSQARHTETANIVSVHQIEDLDRNYKFCIIFCQLILPISVHDHSGLFIEVSSLHVAS